MDVPQPHHDLSGLDLAVAVARLMADSHCEDVTVLDVRGVSTITDFIILASGTSDRQMRSVADDVEGLAEAHGRSKLSRDLDEATTWVVSDYGDVMIHLFEPETRRYYDLEMLWGDATEVAWQRDAEASRDQS